MDKNKREKDYLYEYAVQNTGNYQFTSIDEEKESYFSKRDDGSDKTSYLKSYEFEKLPELMQELDLLWKMEELPEALRKVVGIAAIKNKISSDELIVCDKTIKTENGDKLPVFIYNF